MVMKVPGDHPIAPICRYDWMSPPYTPAIQIPQAVEQMRAMIASGVANEASTKATSSSARMYCFNLFAFNNWNNQEFAEMVKLVADYIALQIMKGVSRDPSAAIPEAASNILTLYVSALLFQVPELKSMVHGNVLQAASQNVPQLENLKKEILQMYNNQGMGVQPMMMHPQQQQYPGMYPQQMQPMYPGNMPMMHPQQQHHPQVSGHMQNHTSGFGNNGGYAQPGGSGFMAESFDENDRYASRRPAPMLQEQQQPYHQHQQPQQQPYQPTLTVTPVVETKPTELKIIEGTEMDRAKHQLAYFGGAISQDMRPRMEAFQKSAEQLSVATIDEDNGPLAKKWSLVFTLDEAIAMGRVEHQKRQLASGNSDLMREFVIVATPIIVAKGMTQYWNMIRSATSFVGVAKKIQMLCKALEQKRSSENEEEINETLNFLSTIDVKLTDVINKFLSINLGLKKISIDSFTGDVEMLGDYLNKKFGPMEAQAFAAFENEIYDILAPDIDAETAKEILYRLGDNLEEDYPLYPENYSITYLFLNSKELGYQITDEPVRISERTTPSLFNVVNSLLSHKKAMEMSTLADLLVCSDGVKYRVYRDYRLQGQYLISLA